jgi:septum formation protein
VHTAHCLLLPATRELLEHTASAVVACRQPSAAELERYLASEQWRGKAGGYGIQDPAQSFLTVASGSFDTVVGLSVAAVRELLERRTGP